MLSRPAAQIGRRFALAALALLATGRLSVGEDQPAAAPPPASAAKIELAEGKMSLTMPKDWVKKEPSSRIIAYEFATPTAEGDATAGRFTVMPAGGSVEANIDRWIGQFTQPDGKASRERAVIKKETIAGHEVHLVDISGTYADRRGPFAPAVNRESYRMLGAIIVSEKFGLQFLKLYGPNKTIAAQEKAFGDLVKTLTVSE